MNNLKKYWFKFHKMSYPTYLNLGCGVTALDKNDAIGIINKFVLSNEDNALVTEIIEGVSASDLEKSHVQPNVGNMDVRGIWFPQGYENESVV